MKKWIFFMGICLQALQLFAQNDLGSVGPQRIIGPNPEAARIASYGQYHISPYTGKPGIDVPIYTIKTPRFELPVSLDYEATGAKVNDLASWVGTGWVLNAGGMITRVVVGLPDEYQGGFLSQTVSASPPTNNDFYYNDVTTHYIETEPDKYYFSFNGKSGDFTYDANKQIFQTEANGLKITNTGNGFTIVDDEGNSYEFTTAEYTVCTVNSDVDYVPYSPSAWWLTKMTSADGQDVINFTYQNDAQPEEDYQSTYTETYGPSVTLMSGDGNSEVAVTTGNVQEYSTAVMTREWYAMRLRSISFRNGRLDFNRVSDRLDGGTSRLTSIDIYNYLNGAYTKLRSVNLLTDYFHYSGPYSNSQIYYSNTVGRYRLKLTGVQNIDASGAVVGQYSFDYDLSSELPFRGSLQQDYWGFFNGATVNDDKHTTVPAQLTDDLLHTVGGADREPHEAYMKAGSLTKLTYPTGGYTVFGWEAHQYQSSTTTTVPNTAGISSIGVNVPYSENTFTITEGDANSYITVDVNIPTWPGTYYNDPNHPNWDDSVDDARPSVYLVNMANGQVIFMYHQISMPAAYHQDYIFPLQPGNYKVITEDYVNTNNSRVTATITYHTTQNVVSVKYAGGLRIATISNYNFDNTLINKETYKYGANESGYGDLSVSPLAMNTSSYIKNFTYWWSIVTGGGGCAPASTQKKVYKSEPVAALTLAAGSAVTYNVVAKYVGDATTNAGKTIYQFLPQTSVQVSSATPLATGEYVTTRYSWRKPVIQEQQEYKYEGGVYTLVKDTHNDYNDLGLGLVTVYKAGYASQVIQLNCFPTTQVINMCYYTNYGVSKGILQMTASTIKEYDHNGALTVETDKTYTYDGQYHCYLASESFTNSRGQVITTTNKYPFDKSQISGLSTNASLAIDRMMAKNMVAPAIETQTLRNSSLMQSRRTNYRIWDGAQNIVKPENVQIQTGAGPLESRLSYSDYDATGNLLQQSKTNDLSISYVWDYVSGYPIADVKNATDQDIAYTSFEAEGSGGWTLGQGSYQAGGIEGQRTWSMTTPVTRQGMVAATTYIISYWTSNSQAFTIAGTVTGYPVRGKTISVGGVSWTYYEHRVTGVTSASLGGSTGAIDCLRLYPLGAQMTSYTYQPLDGFRTVCEANNKISYYQYDGMGRLQIVKDQDGNIIKTIDYHYKGQ